MDKNKIMADVYKDFFGENLYEEEKETTSSTEVETLEDYELMEDKEININENETAVIVLENKKQRGRRELLPAPA